TFPMIRCTMRSFISPPATSGFPRFRRATPASASSYVGTSGSPKAHASPRSVAPRFFFTRRSFKTGDPVATLVLDRLGPTLTLTGGALFLALLVAVPLGVLAAIRRNTMWDALASSVSLFGISFPSFWLGIMLILLFSEVLGLLPPSGLSEYGRDADLGPRLRHAVLPVLTLGLIQMASFMRFTRSSLLEALQQAYVRTARAKARPDARVLWRHALRNALIPV